MTECCEGPAACRCGLISQPDLDDTVEIPAICGDCVLQERCCRDCT